MTAARRVAQRSALALAAGGLGLAIAAGALAIAWKGSTPAVSTGLVIAAAIVDAVVLYRVFSLNLHVGGILAADAAMKLALGFAGLVLTPHPMGGPAVGERPLVTVDSQFLVLWWSAVPTFLAGPLRALAR